MDTISPQTQILLKSATVIKAVESVLHDGTQSMTIKVPNPMYYKNSYKHANLEITIKRVK